MSNTRVPNSQLPPCQSPVKICDHFLLFCFCRLLPPASTKAFKFKGWKIFLKIHKQQVVSKKSRVGRLSQQEWGCFSFQKSHSLFCVVLFCERCLSEANCYSQVSYPRKTVLSDGKPWEAVSHSCSVRSHYDEGLPAQAICPSLGVCFAFWFCFLLYDAAVNQSKIKPRRGWSHWGWVAPGAPLSALHHPRILK